MNPFRFSLVGLTLILSLHAGAQNQNKTKAAVQLGIDDSALVSKVSDFLMQQPNRRTMPEYSKDWRSFNFTVDMYAEGGKYKKLGYMPHKTSLEMDNVPVGVGFETLDRDTFDPLTTFDYLCEAGVKYARCQSGWWKCERTPGKFDFKWIDDVVDGLKAKKIETWLSLSFGHPAYCPSEEFDKQWADAKAKGVMVPGWARGWVGESPLYHGDKAMKAWLKYVNALTKHVKGRVNIFEIWNEPEYFWRYKGKTGGDLYGDVQAARDFAKFVKITAAEVRKVIPDAQITFNLAALSSVWVTTLAEEGIADVIDFYNYHTYKRTPEEGVKCATDQIRALFKRADGKPMRIWQGESGRASDKSKLFAFPTQYSQAKFITRRITSDLAVGCEVSSQFTVADFLCYYENGADQYYGIWNTRENKPKLGWYALQSMCYLMENIELAPEYFFNFSTIKNANGFMSLIPYLNVEVAQFKRGDIPVIAFWQKEHIDISASPLLGRLQFVTGAPSKLQHPIIIDPIRGIVWDAKKALSYTSRGAEAVDVWAYDYPLFLTDLKFFEQK